MTDPETLIIECIGRVANAYQELEVAKSDCEAVVNAEIDTLVNTTSERITKATKANIKEIAKASISGKMKALAEKSAGISAIIEEMLERADGGEAEV